MNPRRNVPAYLTVAACFLFTPLAAKSASIEVTTNSGTTCYLLNDVQLNVPDSGACSGNNSIMNGGSVAQSFSFEITVNGDPYEISGNYSASYSEADGGSNFSVNPTVTYLGASPVANPGGDTIQLDWLQSIYDPACCSWAGQYEETVQLSMAGEAPGSSTSGQLQFDINELGGCVVQADGYSNCLPQLSSPPYPNNSAPNYSGNLDFGAYDSNDYLYADYNFSYYFAQGTQPLASGSDAAPEPPAGVLGGAGLVLLILGAGFRRRWGSNS